MIVNQPNVRRTCFREIGLTRDEARAQAIVDASTDNALTATGELDASRYGDLRRPSGLWSTSVASTTATTVTTASRALPSASARVSTNNASPWRGRAPARVHRR